MLGIDLPCSDNNAVSDADGEWTVVNTKNHVYKSGKCNLYLLSVRQIHTRLDIELVIGYSYKIWSRITNKKYKYKIRNTVIK